MKRAYRKTDFVPGNTVRISRSGGEFFEHLRHIIRAARYEIHIQIYIWEPDETGREISRLLIEAAARGVAVYLILDAFGSVKLRKDKEWCRAWHDAGIRFRFFGEPLTGKKVNIGRRMHHKFVIVDGRRTIVTGRNIADRYNDMPGRDAWLDFAAFVDGPAAVHLRRIALLFWPRAQRFRIPVFPEWLELSPLGDVPVKIARNDFFRGIYEMYNSYLDAFERAESDITAVAAYFLPGRRMRMALQHAAGRGARVRLLFSRYSDVPLANHATQYLYSWLFRCGVEIYEWYSSIVHGKVAVVDQKWATVGSYNLNYLSALESVELNYIFWDEKVAGELRTVINRILDEESEKIRAENYNKNHSLLKQFKEWSAFVIFRSLLRFLLFFGGRHKAIPDKIEEEI